MIEIKVVKNGPNVQVLVYDIDHSLPKVYRAPKDVVTPVHTLGYNFNSKLVASKNISMKELALLIAQTKL